MKVIVKIVSYNVLANGFIYERDEAPGNQARRYPKSDPSFLQWVNRKIPLIKDLLKHDADILCLQEVETGEMYDFLREKLDAAGYASAFIERWKGKQEILATFYKKEKFADISSEKIEFPDDKSINNQPIIDIALKTRISYGDQLINVAHAHLVWNKQASEDNAFKDFSGYKFMEALLTKIAQNNTNEKWIICGDFNVKPGSSIHNLFIEQGFTDAFSKKPYDTCFTNGRSKRIDFIFLSPNITEYEAHSMQGLNAESICPTEEIPSDHLPIAVSIEMSHMMAAWVNDRNDSSPVTGPYSERHPTVCAPTIPQV